MRDFPLTEQLKTILATPDCAEWILAKVQHGARLPSLTGNFASDSETMRRRNGFGSGGCSLYFSNFSSFSSLVDTLDDKLSALSFLLSQAISVAHFE